MTLFRMSSHSVRTMHKQGGRRERRRSRHNTDDTTQVPSLACSDVLGRLPYLRRGDLARDVVLPHLPPPAALQQHEVGELGPVHATVRVGVDLHEQMLEVLLREEPRLQGEEGRDELVADQPVVAIHLGPVEVSPHELQRLDAQGGDLVVLPRPCALRLVLCVHGRGRKVEAGVASV